MRNLTRREFVGSVAAVASAASIRTAFGSPNETVRVAVLGSGRGKALARFFSQARDSQVAAICDVDENWGKPVCEQIKTLTGKRPEFVVDFRTLLERSDIDALVVATPDHWHAPATIHACLAGKDVYVEKPASHNIIEGRTMVKAARRYKRIVQHGTNMRSDPHYPEAWKLLRDGVIGKVLMVKAINNQRASRFPHRPDEPVPPGVHYDLWQGPAPKRPFNLNRFHTTWHFMYDYGTGELGNDGVHQVDVGRWGLGLKAPNAVTCSAAKLGSKGDSQEFPDTMNITWEYDDLLYVFEQRLFTPYRMRGHRVDNDNIFYGDKGFMMIDRDGYRVFYGDEPGPSGTRRFDKLAHYQNFIDCVKSRRQQDLNADIEEGHYSALLCHLGNIAYRTGRRLKFDPKTETFLGDDQANQYLGREYRKGFELPLV